jgi:hypothetical protein
MKFVSLRTQRTHQRGTLGKPSRAAFESFTKPTAVSHPIHTYSELRQQIHHDLRIQHPEWVEPNGESSMRLIMEYVLKPLSGQFSPNQTQITESRVPASTIG